MTMSRTRPNVLELTLAAETPAGKLGECARYARAMISLVTYCLHNEVLDAGRFHPSASDAAHALELAEALCLHVEILAHDMAEESDKVRPGVAAAAET